MTNKRVSQKEFKGKGPFYCMRCKVDKGNDYIDFVIEGCDGKAWITGSFQLCPACHKQLDIWLNEKFYKDRGLIAK